MSKTNVFLSLACGLMILGSCVKDVGKLPVTSAAAVNACDTITYTKHIRPLYDSACSSCHGPTLASGAPLMNSYEDIKVYVDNGQIRSTVFFGTPDPMPQGGTLTPRQLALLKCWLDNGGKE